MSPPHLRLRDVEIQLGRRQLRGLDVSFLWGEVCTRMLDRMQWVRQKPHAVLVLGDSRLDDAQRLAHNYPGATILELSVARERRLMRGFQARQAAGTTKALRTLVAREGLVGRLGSLLGIVKPSDVRRVTCNSLSLPLRDAVVDLVWLNGMLHWWSDWPGHLQALRRAARPGALMSFSLLGVDSFRQLRPVAPGLMRFPDMHDLGDALVRAGWAEPVVDMERIDLSWRQPDSMLADLRALGGNCLEGRFAGLRGRKWRAASLAALDSLRDSDGLLRIQLELILGHAWRADDPDAAQAWKPVRLSSRASAAR